MGHPLANPFVRMCLPVSKVDSSAEGVKNVYGILLAQFGKLLDGVHAFIIQHLGLESSRPSQGKHGVLKKASFALTPAPLPFHHLQRARQNLKGQSAQVAAETGVDFPVSVDV